MRRFFRMTSLFLVVNVLLLGGLTFPQHTYEGLSCLHLASFQQNRGRSGLFNYYLIDARTGFMAMQREEVMWRAVNSSPRVRVMARTLPSKQGLDSVYTAHYEVGLATLDALGNIDSRHITAILSNIALNSQASFNEDDRWAQSLLWSPDWTRLAMRWEDAARQDYLTLVNEDGSDVRTVQLSPAQNREADAPLAWSPDNRYLLMRANASDSRYSLWDTQTLREVDMPFSESLSAPTWSSSDPHLSAIVTENNAAPRILLFSPSDGALHLTTLPQNYNPSALVWSPTGHYVAIVGYQRLTEQATPDDQKTYLFVTADGTLLPAKASGLLRQWVSENVDYVVYAGIWSTTGDRWYFLGDVPDSVPTAVALRALDIEADSTESIASQIPVNWAAEIFNEPLQGFAARLSVGNFTFSPFTPATQRPATRRDLLIVTNANGTTLNIDLYDTQTHQHTRLVSGADRLSASEAGYGGQFRLRATATNDTWIAIHWIKGEEQHLTWLKADGSDPYEIDGIPPLAQVNVTNNYLSYRRYDGDQQWSVVIVDLLTGQQRTLLANLPPFDDARAALAPNGSSMAVLMRSGLYIAALDGSWSKQIDPAARQLPWWLPEVQNGDKLAYLKMIGSELRIVVADTQGNQLLDKDVVLPNSSVVLRNVGLLGWTRCPE